jgi:hypothetical protein
MADTLDEPNWSLLPHDPVQFFGLRAGFDRRDLKRSYNQLIRRFKPERFPQEFQRIRAAYEQLENAIRYGQATDFAEPPTESFEWLPQAAPTPAAQFQFSAPNAPSPALPLHQRIQCGSVSEIYRELRDLPDKSPYDFYSLAVMSDVVDHQEGQQFVRWILQGLTAHPDEFGLSRLLHAYFSGPIESEQCESLLIACSKIVREDMFFPLTEPLWRLLLRTQNFSHFRSALQQCEANLKGVNIDSQLAFYMQILKPAVWVADPEWINESYNFIEQNYDRIPSYLDYDLEILSRLRAYIQVRELFVQGNEIRHRLDRAVRDYFNEDQLTGDQSVLAAQVRIAQDGEGLGAAFSDFGSPVYEAFFAVWVWVSYDVGERHVEPPKEAINENIWQARTNALIWQLADQTRKSRLGLQWAAWRILYRCAQGACLLICPFLLAGIGVVIGPIFMSFMEVLRFSDTGIAFGGVGGIIMGIFFGIRLCKSITIHYWQPFTRRRSAECYRQIWQREIINFLARSHLPYQTLRAYIQPLANTTTTSAWVRHYVDQDYALPMFAIANRFVV